MRRYYDESDYFEKRMSVFSDLGSRFQKYRIKNVSEILRVQAEDTVLDLGCGWGTFCFALAGRCGRIVGLDYSRKSIEVCHRLAQGMGTSSTGRVHLWRCAKNRTQVRQR